VRAARVEEGDEGRDAECHGDLHGARHGNPSHGLQGEVGRLAVVLRVARGFCGVFDLHTVQEEDAPAKPVMATSVFFITIETEAQTMPFRHLIRCEAPLVALAATLLGGRWRSRERRRSVRSAGRGAGAGRRPRGDARGGGCTHRSSSISSTWRAKLMAAASVVGLWMRMAWLRGGRSPPVKSCTR
jgi:hypothetical protein